MQRKKFLCLLTAIAFVLVSLPTVYAKDYAMFQNVEGNYEWLVYVPVNDDDYIEGNFTTMGAFSNEVYFTITDPQGAQILNLGLVKDTNKFNFTAQDSGKYTLNFSNPYYWDTDVSLYVHTQEESTNLPPTPQVTGDFPETYVFIGFTVFAFILFIATAIYAIAKSGAPNRLTGQEKEIKLLERKINYAMVGVTVGMLFLFSSITYIYTPYSFWGSVLPDSIMQGIDSNASIIAGLSVILLFIGFGILFSMIAAIAYYGRAIKRKRTQTPAPNTVESSPKP